MASVAAGEDPADPDPGPPLEARGLLRRTPDPADRRNRVVTLTAAGRELVTSCRAGIRGVEAEVLAGLEPDERVVFVAVLERLTDAVRDR